MQLSRTFWRNRNVLLTGHTGFKGAWMGIMLGQLGARVTGIGLKPDKKIALFNLINLQNNIKTYNFNICNQFKLAKIIKDIKPSIVIHMAAQSLVRHSYNEPVETAQTNIMGTINLLEALRNLANFSSLLVVTSDKVYKNDGTGEAFTEDNPLGGSDPYSASKAATEIITSAWRQSFFEKSKASILTARAGNVIGGGDFSDDRIIPDLWRAKHSKRELEIRYPNAIRPWQHVLDINYGYLAYIEAVMTTKHGEIPKSLNFGPIDKNCISVLSLAKELINAMNSNIKICIKPSTLREKQFLSIDARLAQQTINWSPILTSKKMIDWTAKWYVDFDAGNNPMDITRKQVQTYMLCRENTDNGEV